MAKWALKSGVPFKMRIANSSISSQTGISNNDKGTFWSTLGTDSLLSEPLSVGLLQLKQSGIPDHFDTIITGLDLESNPNVLNEAEHGDELKRAFLSRALPVFLSFLSIIYVVIIFLFIVEKIYALDESKQFRRKFQRNWKALSVSLVVTMVFIIFGVNLAFFLGTTAFGMGATEDFDFAIMTTTSDKHHFIVWNAEGFECQRFTIDDIHVLNFDTMYLYSPYYMSAYSFSTDMMYFGMASTYFMVMPSIKEQTFLGELGVGMYDVPFSASSHFLHNSSNVWLIGGTEAPDSEFETSRILNLEYVMFTFEAA